MTVMKSIIIYILQFSTYICNLSDEMKWEYEHSQQYLVRAKCDKVIF